MSSEERSGTPVRGFLVVQTGDFEGTEHPLAKDETIIGRNPTTDITLLDEGISREHALILRDESTCSFTIEDLQSTNGTKVNGKRVRSAVLADGDAIEVGHTRFRFELR
ncbi:MAG TPA: FHA domain-containing protein [Myxococcota bacterium]|jgi:pSer/pThr/pTyr-binding forkhead associated (FHA) protein